MRRESIAAAMEQAPPVIIGPMPQLLIGHAIDAFLSDGERRGWSTRTLNTYRRILYSLADTLPIGASVHDVTENEIRRFLASKSGKARGTIAHAEAVVGSFTKWCFLNGKMKDNPMLRIARTRRIPSDELDVTTVSTEDVPKLLAAASALDFAASPALYAGHKEPREVWTHRNCIGILAYLGPRRRAVARLRKQDYRTNSDGTAHVRFREKGGKVIWKPAPEDLQRTLDASIGAGAIVAKTDFLVPPAPFANYSRDVLEGRAERDDRCIWEIVKDVGRKAGVETHVHALRAAFAVFYLEQNPGDLKGLQNLLGHRNISTTAIYLRKLESSRSMEPVRHLSWGAAA